MIEAIETDYKGYRFRSRLEARWAVFFDGIRWPWSYEAKVFSWIDGEESIQYLPDFAIGRRPRPSNLTGTVDSVDASREAMEHAREIQEARKRGVVRPWGADDSEPLLLEIKPSSNATGIEKVSSFAKRHEIERNRIGGGPEISSYETMMMWGITHDNYGRRLAERDYDARRLAEAFSNARDSF